MRIEPYPGKVEQAAFPARSLASRGFFVPRFNLRRFGARNMAPNMPAVRREHGVFSYNPVMTTFLLLVAASLLLGCEENIAPRIPSVLPFALYGVISPDLEVQSIRVYPREDLPSFEASGIEDIRVTSVDLNTGNQMTWRDSIIVEPNELYDFIFWAPFRAEYDRTYRIEASRLSDGTRSFADVRIPPMVTVRLDGNEVSKMKVLVEGENIRLFKPEITYTVSVDIGYTLSFPVSLLRKEKPINEGWTVEFDLAGNRYYVQGEYMYTTEVPYGIRCPVLRLHKMTFHAIVGDKDWDPPGGSFDFDQLSHPGTMSNVQNGMGFVGGGYRIHELLYPSREMVEDACFIYVW